MLSIQLTNLGKKFNKEWIFKDLSYTINGGDKVVILGGNGSGKSTLLQVISGFITENEGEVIYKSDDKIIPVDKVKNYISFEMKVIADLKNSKNLSEEQQKEKEGELILQQIIASDDVLMLDEQGAEVSSVGFARFLEKKMISGIKRLVVVIGGPYGFSENVYLRANGKICLSRMTFSHQMVRLIFTEQLYRALTILKGEPYHHQ